MSRYKPRGWFGEPHRHYLAAKGIKSKYASKIHPRYFQNKFGSMGFSDSENLKAQKIVNVPEKELKIVELENGSAMLYDEEIGEFLLGYNFNSVEEALAFGKDAGIKTYMASKESRVQSMSPSAVAQRFDAPEVNTIYSGEQFDAVLNMSGFNALAFETGVRAVTYNKENDVLIVWTEGDFDVFDNPTKNQIQQILQMYDKREVTPSGERIDSRFTSQDDMIRQQELNAQSLAMGLTDDEERFI